MIQTAATEGGSQFASKNDTKNVLSLESLSGHDLEQVQSNATQITSSLKEIFGSISAGVSNLGMEELTSTQLEAGTFAAMAMGDVATYAQAALGSKAPSGKNVTVMGAQTSGIAGSLDFRDDFAMEAFDVKELTAMIPYSIAFNIQASRQDEFSETFYPTVVVSPDMGGMDVTVEQVTVFNTVQHKTSGVPTDFNQRNLLEAVGDYTILADESTALVPFVQPDDSNLTNFVDAALIATTDRIIAGVSVTTAPLKVGKSIDLIGVSNHPGLIGNGVLDSTDAIDSRLFLEQLVFSNPFLDGTTPATDVFKFNVSRLPRNAFLDSIEGAGREMQLNFRSDAIVLNKATLAADGTVPASIQAVIDADYTVRLQTNISGNAHVEFGTVEVFAGSISVLDIIDVDGNEISKTTGAGLAIVNSLLEIKLEGYVLGASRTNSNRRTKGLLLNTNLQTERFAIPLGAPISAPSPIGSDRDTRDLESLITAARIRNSNNAVTTLLNYADALRVYVSNARKGNGNVQIEGVARHVVTPFYQEVDLNLVEAMNSIRSKDRAEDISSALINTVNDIAYRMYRESAYQPALDASSMGAKKPRLLIGTDTVLQRHLMIGGDTRTFGMTFNDAKIVSSFDARMANTIIVTFSRDGADGTADPLSFGNHGWIPELTTTMSVTRDGAMYQEAMVQPRSRHVNNLPVMAKINVTGLEEVMSKKTVAPKQAV